jgi:homoserine kinase
MNQRPGQRAPAHYELRIEGHLDERWSAWFGGLTLIPEDDGTTTLRGAVTDQPSCTASSPKFATSAPPCSRSGPSTLRVAVTKGRFRP